jgi:HEAT repeat protein
MLTPDQFQSASAYQLLAAAGEGKVGVDHRWLKALLEKPQEEVVAAILQFGSEDHLDDPVFLESELIAILRHLRTPDAVPFYVGLVREEPTDVPDELVDAFYEVRHAALEPLLSLYDELQEEQGSEVAFLLASFRIPDERVLRILLDRLEYDAGDGAIALGMYGDPAARQALETLLNEVDDPHLRRDIEQALEDLGRPVEDEEPTPFDVYAQFPEHAYPDAEELSEADRLEMLASSDAEYRFAAAAGFINQELSDEAVRALLQRARSDEEANVRAKCWEALAGVSDRQEIREPMLARLQDESAPMLERAGALLGLGQISNEQPVRKYAEQFYDNPETRAEAMAAMWNSLDRSFRSYFPKHLVDPDPRVQKQAITGVGYLGITDSSEKLRGFFDDPDLRANALFAYALSMRAEISPGRVRGLLRRIEDLASGFELGEQQLVQAALDERLMLHGHDPVFRPLDGDEDEAEEEPSIEAAPVQKVGRNEPCPCGSGKKYKKCCGLRPEAGKTA